MDREGHISVIRHKSDTCGGLVIHSGATQLHLLVQSNVMKRLYILMNKDVLGLGLGLGVSANPLSRDKELIAWLL